MRQLTITLGILLALSVMVNVMTLFRPKSAHHESEGTSQQTTQAERDDSSRVKEEMAALNRQLNRIRKELRQLRDEIRSSDPAPESSRAHASSEPDLPDAVASDPTVARLFSEQRAMNDLWADLKKLKNIQKMMGPEKYQETVIATTMEFLGLDPTSAPAFKEAAAQALQNLEAARNERREAEKNLSYGGQDSSSLAETRKEVWNRYHAQKKEALGLLDPYLKDSTRHRQFQGKMETWLYYVTPTVRSGEAVDKAGR